jgi:2-iminobutanoate/2-iminopropanoate deaminase
MNARPVNVSSIRMPAPLTHGFVVEPGTRLLFVSGLTARDGEGSTVAPGDAGAQAEHILSVIEDVVAAAGGSMVDVIRLTIFVADRSYAGAVGKARARFFPDPPFPASTMVEARLMSDDQLVEIEAIAALPAS